jgi:CHAD domain-containing protein
LRPEVGPHQSAGQAWVAVMHAALAQMVANVPGTLDALQNEAADGIEYLHQLRIGLRRLRVGVTLAKAFGQPAPAWKPVMSETMRALNPARDWDVFLHETLPKLRTSESSALLIAPQAEVALEQAMLKQLHTATSAAHQQARTQLLSPTFTQLVLDIGRDLLTEHETVTDATDVRAEEASVWANEWASKILEKRWRTLRKRCRNFARLSPTERHMARIAAKKMRYAADALAPLYGKRGERFIEALSTLQNGLGKANDAHVGALLLDALPKKSAPLSFQLGKLAGALETDVRRDAQLSGAIWRRLAQSRLFWR